MDGAVTNKQLQISRLGGPGERFRGKGRNLDGSGHECLADSTGANENGRADQSKRIWTSLKVYDGCGMFKNLLGFEDLHHLWAARNLGVG